MNIFELFDRINTYLDLPPGLLVRVAFQENGKSWKFNPNARSWRGAMGIMQITGQTVQQIFNIARYQINPFNPIHAIVGAGVYLKWLRDQFGDWRTAIAAYNWGYGNVRRMVNQMGYIHEELLPAETRNYLSVADDLGL